MLRRLTGIALSVCLAPLALTACGNDGAGVESPISGDTVTVYSSLPRSGPFAEVARDVLRAEKLALREAGGRAGPFRVSLSSLDSADARSGRTTPARVAANARKAVADRQTIAYLGELESGASAASLPVLNAAGVLQVSPRDTLHGLTGAGAPGEPERFYPSGRRTFARVVPGAEEEARALVALMAARSVRRLVVADDAGLAGSRLGDRLAALAWRAGIDVVDRVRLAPPAGVPEDLGRRVRERHADALAYVGAYRGAAVRALRAVDAAAPRVRLFGADALTLAPALPRRAGALARRMVLVGVDPRGAGRAAFERAFVAAYGRRPHRQAILGFRAMWLVLDAVRRAGARATSRREVAVAATAGAREPPARFRRLRAVGNRLVPVGRPL